jgi:hypothetical protein
MSVVLYTAGKATDFQLESADRVANFDKLRSNVRDLLRSRGNNEAIRLLSQFPFRLMQASNHFNDEFDVLHADVPLALYEQARLMSPADRLAVAQIAGTFDELGAYVRIVAVDLDMDRNTEKSEPPSGLTRAEINKLVYKYIGVDAGYLVGFSYQKHHDFYVELELDIDPFKYEGTTRQRFTTILEEAEPPIQARIVRGIVERYPPNSAPYRTQALNNEIQRWINRLVSADGVPVPSLRITSEVVERALADAERLISSSGATSGVDRVHTALHGYLLQVCVDQTIPAPNDASITQLFKLIRAKHPKMNDLGPRSDDIARILNSMASVLDALNPIRNLASVAHPNSRLLDDAEARLVVNVIRTILHYLDTKLQSS